MKFFDKFLYLNVKKIKYLDMNKINKFLQLASLIAKFSTVNTDKGQLTATDEIAEGVEVYIKDETSGEFVAAPDGDYETEESIITVKDGKVEKIEAKEATQEPTTETMNEEFSKKVQLAEQSYNDLMQKIHNAIGEDNYVVDAGDGWAVVVIYENDTEKTYRYTYSLDAEGQIVLGDRVEVYPRYVTDEEAKQLDFAEQAPTDEQAQPDEKDEKIKELENKITELEGLLQDRDAVIEELTAKIKELQDEKAAPVEEPVKMSATIARIQGYSEKDIPALKYFK